MDQNKIFKMVEYAHDQLNEIESHDKDNLISIGICIGKARDSIDKLYFELLEEMPIEDY